MDAVSQNPQHKLSAIDRALAAAKARKAAAASATPDGPEASSTPPPTKRSARTDESREESRQKRDAERAERLNAKAARLASEAEAKASKAAAREAAKAQRRAAKEAEKASKRPAHMKKVERARSKCPPLSSAAELVYGEATANLTAQQIDALAQHLLVHVRASRTTLATTSEQLPMGATVRITGGEAKYIGAVGTVVHSQRLRAKVAVEGQPRPVYIYTGEAVVVEESAAAVG